LGIVENAGIDQLASVAGAQLRLVRAALGPELASRTRATASEK
jgi:hypothetical protein